MYIYKPRDMLHNTLNTTQNLQLAISIDKHIWNMNSIGKPQTSQLLFQSFSLHEHDQGTSPLGLTISPFMNVLGISKAHQRLFKNKKNTKLTQVSRSQAKDNTRWLDMRKDMKSSKNC